MSSKSDRGIAVQQAADKRLREPITARVTSKQGNAAVHLRSIRWEKMARATTDKRLDGGKTKELRTGCWPSTT